MGVIKSTQRERFEENTFPHVEALWRTALWLTRRWSYAEDLVLKTMTQACSLWPVSDDLVDSKARLFRILTNEFSAAGDLNHQPGRFLSENGKTVPKTGSGGRQNPVASLNRQELLLLEGISDISVKGAVARLRPQSRLIMILVVRERFSYAEIAYITGLRKDSVRSILARLRRLVPRYLVRHADSFVAAPESHVSIQVHGTFSAKGMKFAPNELPGAATNELTTDSAARNWENQGDALDGQC